MSNRYAIKPGDFGLMATLQLEVRGEFSGIFSEAVQWVRYPPVDEIVRCR
jgi:hypothetical protein